MNTHKYNEKQYQFVKLCIALTKQGFQFYRQKGVNFALVFDKYNSKRLFNPFIKLPFVNSILRIAGDNTKNCYQFNQWAGRN